MPSDFTPNNVWGSSTPAGQVEELVLPSGQTCAAKRVGIESLLESGIAADADMLTASVGQYVENVGKKNARVDEKKILSDPAALKSVIQLADRVMPSIVVSPPVAVHFTTVTVGKTTTTKTLTDEERAEIREIRGQENLVFTDQIGFDDKMWLFEWATGGIQAMSSFRSGSSDDMGGLANGQKPPHKAKRRPRRP